ncbi:MAG: hypothetical protein GC158_16675 [Cyanobacteria bacterium RI_101]|nr:hypothetical protein [Cyanobacteria bacterium RI_101]
MRIPHPHPFQKTCEQKKLVLLAALTTGASLSSLALAPSAEAIPVNWALNGVTFTDGASATGGFTYDADTNTYSNVSISVTGPIYASNLPNPRTFSTSNVVVSGSGASALSLGNNFGSIINGEQQVLFNFLSSLSNSGGSVSINTASSIYGIVNGSTSPVSAGSLQGTPVPLESDALPIVGAAAFMAGGLWFKRRRAQAKANLDFLGVASEK